jgi:hypothetical protein
MPSTPLTRRDTVAGLLGACAGLTGCAGAGAGGGNAVDASLTQQSLFVPASAAETDILTPGYRARIATPTQVEQHRETLGPDLYTVASPDLPVDIAYGECSLLVHTQQLTALAGPIPTDDIESDIEASDDVVSAETHNGYTIYKTDGIATGNTSAFTFDDGRFVGLNSAKATEFDVTALKTIVDVFTGNAPSHAAETSAVGTVFDRFTDAPLWTVKATGDPTTGGPASPGDTDLPPGVVVGGKGVVPAEDGGFTATAVYSVRDSAKTPAVRQYATTEHLDSVPFSDGASVERSDGRIALTEPFSTQ